MGALEQLRKTLFGVSLFHLIRGFSGASGGIRHAKSKATPSHPLGVQVKLLPSLPK